MKTDTLFYRLFQRWPKLALELLGLHYGGDSYRFSSEEIKQTAFRIDGIFTPIVDDPEQPVIFTEVQYQPDDDFYDRFISEITLYLRLHKPGRPWLALVIYPKRSVEKQASVEFEPFMSLPQLHRVYLDDYRNRQGLTPTLELVRLIASRKLQTMALARELAGRKDELGPESLDFIETILVYKLPKLSREEISAMLALNDIELKQTRFYQEIAEEENQKGRQEESLKLINRMIRHKFGINAESNQVAQKLPPLSLEQLEELAEALLDLNQMSDLNEWLAQRDSL